VVPWPVRRQSPTEWLYQLTEKGLNASITATGAKYYKDDALN
jgi:hypothetical protein